MKINRLVRLFSIVLLVFVLRNNVTAQDSNNLPLRFKVGTFNVGHFNQGSLGGFEGIKSQTMAALKKWQYWIGNEGFDLFAINEWNEYFDSSGTIKAADHLLDPFFKYSYLGKRNKWIYNGLASNFQLENVKEITWWKDYYAIYGDLRVGDKVITFISTHIPWQKEHHDEAFNKLIEFLKQFEYFVCLGDMNAPDKNQKLFLDNGFNMANGGYLGWFPTASGRVLSSGYKGNVNDNIDNIVTSSNIKIVKVNSPNTGLNDFDHKPIIAEIIIAL